MLSACKTGSGEIVSGEGVLGMSRAIDDLVETIETMVTDAVAPVESEEIGRLVLDGLRALDEVAYLRFASVYRDFQGASDFEQALADLGEQVTAAE